MLVVEWARSYWKPVLLGSKLRVQTSIRKPVVMHALNLEHYKYDAPVYYADVKNLTGRYDCAIIDLPYNLYSYSNEDIVQNIIQSCTQLANRIVIASTTDITTIIKQNAFAVTDYCTVEKRGKGNF